METAKKTELQKIMHCVARDIDQHAESGALLGELVEGSGKNAFTLKVENDFLVRLATKRYFLPLKEKLEESFGVPVKLNIEVDEALKNREEPASTKFKAFAPSSRKPEPVKRPKPKKNGFLKGVIREDYTLDSFVVGDCNTYAFKAISDVASNAKSKFCPVYLYSSSGLGKTHLLQGLCNALRREHKHLKVFYLTSEDFTNMFLSALRSNKAMDFRQEMRDLDVLIVDDVHFLSTAKASQEEFAHTFNTLQNTSSVLIISSDAPPPEKKEINKKLRQRFGGGLVLELEMPDKATRKLILESKLRKNHLGDYRDEQWQKVLDYIAGLEFDSIRDYEGTLNRVAFTIANNNGEGTVSVDKVRAIIHRQPRACDQGRMLQARLRTL
ncbi:MAG: DnaA/Hda family protein [Planctomycetota bacterium]|nr:DnaA/Hda family protein [Planctomycetota bacterium]